MGEANRRKSFVARADCICGSGLQSKECCFTKGFWNKQPASIKLNNAANTAVNEKCYMSVLSCCSEKISREHLVSKTVLNALSQKAVLMEGLPWIGKKEKIAVSIENLVAKCLCRDHNAALSDLDVEMGRFVRTLRDVTVGQPSSAISTVFSGHDIERWILKTHLALSHSGNLSNDSEVVVPQYENINKCLELIEDFSLWQLPLGLYLHGHVGELIGSNHQLYFYPLYNDTDTEMLGMGMELYGLKFTLLFSHRRPITNGLYRPGSIKISSKSWDHNIIISWNDNVRHGGINLRPTAPPPNLSNVTTR